MSIPNKIGLHPHKRQKLNDDKMENKLLFSSQMPNQKQNINDLNDNDNEDELYHSYASERSILPSGKEDQGATVEITNENDETIKSKIETQSKITSKGHDRYRGLKQYEDPSKSNLKNPIPKFKGIGPQRAPDNVKITCRFDYQPDICKDWKETGYCGYGMSCKFLHDRSDYKFGWQLDRDYKKKEELKNLRLQKKMCQLKMTIMKYMIATAMMEVTMITQMIQNYLLLVIFVDNHLKKKPVITNCNHYYCEQCALNQYRKTPACAICGENTHGQFHTADKLIKTQMSKKKD